MIRLSKLEEELLNVLWSLGRAFPKVIISKLKKPTPPYNTVLSVIRKLEKQGFIGFEKYGKSHEYFPILKKEEYSHSLLKKVFHDLMGGSKEGLLSYFIKEENVDIKELEALVSELKRKKND